MPKWERCSLDDDVYVQQRWQEGLAFDVNTAATTASCAPNVREIEKMRIDLLRTYRSIKREKAMGRTQLNSSNGTIAARFSVCSRHRVHHWQSAMEADDSEACGDRGSSSMVGLKTRHTD